MTEEREKLYFNHPGCSRRRDNIVRAIRFIKMFYTLTPKKNVYTIKQIKKKLGCSRTNARHWRDAAGYELPIMEVGVDKHHCANGPAAITYGVLDEHRY